MVEYDWYLRPKPTGDRPPPHISLPLASKAAAEARAPDLGPAGSIRSGPIQPVRGNPIPAHRAHRIMGRMQRRCVTVQPKTPADFFEKKEFFLFTIFFIKSFSKIIFHFEN